MATTTYRFLPWARRGLADRIATVDTGGALPSRAAVSVGLTVSSIPEQRYDLAVYGPGDVIGVDPRLIIRTDPRPSSTDVEPNYLPQIEFDPPDFPWLFTPAKAGSDDHLRPWCVLIVVDLAVVAAPRAEAGLPLPVIVVSSAGAAELPDLAESWAWAHAQVIAPTGPLNIAAELTAKPAMNVSRIVAPRRLEPGKRYAACLVPAFDAGVKRGLGDTPDPSAPLGPAWQTPITTDVRLPVYFHWEFATGPAGDFEALARRLKPFRAPNTIGVSRMYVGDAGPELPRIAPDARGAFVEMDGALRAPARASGTLADVAPSIQAALRATLDAGATQSETGVTPTTPVLGPPVYGGWHARQQTIPDAFPAWFRELNLDPRARAAAGLGAEIERVNQQEFMQWCWEQVGEILEANRLLNRARLSLETLTRIHTRHLAALPADRLFAVLAPLHSRIKQGAATIAATIARSSLPNASVDPALRRLTSPQRSVLRAAIQRTAPSAATAGARVRAVARLATGELDVDPTRFVPHGLQGIPALQTLPIPATGEAAIDLSSLGLFTAVPASFVRQLRDDSIALTSAPAPTIVVRPDLRTSGMLVEAHVTAVREELSTVTTPGRTIFGSLSEVVRKRVLPTTEVIERARAARPIGRDDILEPRRPLRPTEPLQPIEPIGPRRPPIEPTEPTDPTRPTRPTGTGGVLVMPDAVKDIATITRLERAVSVLAPSGTIGTPPVARTIVPFGIAPARNALIARTNPRVTIAARLATMVVAGKRNLVTAAPTGILVAPTIDRVMAAPEIDVPIYTYLAALAPERFLPGVGEIPEDAITLLETNPRFVESLMAGLNVEMNRELLWQSFPTDQRGTPFRHFWAWNDGGADIPPIHQWNPRRALGANSRGGAGGQITLLVRGRLLRRYPNTAIYAWRARNNALANPPAAADLKKPVFSGVLGADVAFVGFDLTDADLSQGEGWFFVLQEQPTEPRFGFDELPRGGTVTALATWSDATWEHTGTSPGAYLRIAGNPLAGIVRTGARFVDHAAHLASITIQKPMRVAIHAKSMLTVP
ncbi:MAG: hypothetical protein ABIP93_08650 [Gemmatimonadaceae bacterium]